MIVPTREMLNISEGWQHYYPATKAIDHYYVMKVDRSATVPEALRMQAKNSAKARAQSRQIGSDEWKVGHILFYRHSMTFAMLERARGAAVVKKRRRLTKAADVDSP